MELDLPLIANVLTDVDELAAVVAGLLVTVVVVTLAAVETVVTVEVGVDGRDALDVTVDGSPLSASFFIVAGETLFDVTLAVSVAVETVTTGAVTVKVTEVVTLDSGTEVVDDVTDDATEHAATDAAVDAAVDATVDAAEDVIDRVSAATTWGVVVCTGTTDETTVDSTFSSLGLICAIIGCACDMGSAFITVA